MMISPHHKLVRHYTMQKSRILLVEDDQFLREIYLESLPDERFQVEAACDGEEALEKLKSGQWDCVLLDMMLPKLNGYEILQRIENDPTLKTYEKLVLMTNVEPSKEFEQALLNANGYITKSEYTPEQFVEKVISIIS